MRLLRTGGLYRRLCDLQFRHAEPVVTGMTYGLAPPVGNAPVLR
jgi:hypothetical protein